ncbi:MAG: ATP-binding protein [Kiritimatiellae bacterium]|jgi:energy-coupling factor transporter ATP-binding protein EcfA2|nr:ATP-binding protein [Kiritimatiellia bacterium]MDD3583519.1 ATP-binding protein [Kiritimatiellia bacterium]
MIIQFSVSNYRCFREFQTLNLTASSDKSLPDNCIVTSLAGRPERRWLKGAAIYGANASGKSTVLNALKALAGMVIHSAKITDATEPIRQIDPFALCPDHPEVPTAFGVVFVVDDTRYEYRVAATRKRIWHESLRAFPSARAQTWYARDWSPESASYVWTPERPTGFQRDPQLESYTLSNMLFLSKAVANNRAELEPIFRWFKENLVFLDMSARSHLSLDYTLNQIEQQGEYCASIKELLRHADIGVTGVETIEDGSPEKVEKLFADVPVEIQKRFIKETWLRPSLIHAGMTPVQIPLPWETESAGTRRLFALAGPWLDILNRGKVVCIDELETSMHPHMVRELLRLFFDPAVNTGGAQVIFTTHNPLLLDTTLLRRDQVWFTDKDNKGAAHLYPLTDYSPRKGESLVRGYLSGRYGALPFIPAGLLDAIPSYEGKETTPEVPHD